MSKVNSICKKDGLLVNYKDKVVYNNFCYFMVSDLFTSKIHFTIRTHDLQKIENSTTIVAGKIL